MYTTKLEKISTHNIKIQKLHPHVHVPIDKRIHVHIHLYPHKYKYIHINTNICGLIQTYLHQYKHANRAK